MESVHLSNLPTELLHRIFDFCDTPTILFSLRHVSSQMYQLVESYDRIKLTNTHKFPSDYAAICRIVRPESVVAINLCNDESEMGEHSSLLSFFQKDKWIRLRSLKLQNFSSTDLEYILQDLATKSLTSLSIESIATNNDNVAPIISSALSRFSLETLCFNNAIFILQSIKWPASCQLTHLTIDTCLYKQYILILQRLTHLQTLVMKSCIMSNVKTESTLPSTHIFTYQLLSLSLNDCSLPKENIEKLLRKTPALTYFKLISCKRSLDIEFNGFDWEQFIQEKLPSLKKFEFFFSNRTRVSNFSLCLNTLITSYRSRFWREEKRWFVNAAYVLKSSQIWVYTTPFHDAPYDMSEIRYEISSMNNECSLVARAIDNTFDNDSYVTLTNLNIECSHIGEIGANLLAITLRNNQTVTRLNLRFNELGDSGANSIAEILQHNQTIVTLDLADNRIENLGAKYVADALKRNSTLRTLDMKRNKLMDEGMQYFGDALKMNTTLSELDLRSNQITDQGAKYLADALQINSGLHTLYLAFNQIGNSGAQHLAKALHSNTTLTKLDLGHNNIENKGAQHLADALRVNKTIVSLSLTYNSIGEIGVQHLTSTFQNNKTLTILELDHNPLN